MGPGELIGCMEAPHFEGTSLSGSVSLHLVIACRFVLHRCLGMSSYRTPVPSAGMIEVDVSYRTCVMIRFVYSVLSFFHGKY